MNTMENLKDQEKIIIDVNKEKQKIEGFGTCLISWVEKYRSLYRTDKFQKIYTEKMGMNILRANMWGAVLPEPVENPEDISYKNFNKTVDRATIFIDFAREIKKNNPEIKILGTVWTPPGWMKYNGNLTDTKSAAISGDDYKGINNKVQEHYYEHYAQYLIEWLKWFAEEGVEFYALSLANEPMFTQEFGSCVWTAEDYARMLKILGNKMEEKGFGETKLFGPETMTSHNSPQKNPMYIEEMEKQGAFEYLDVFATHGYEEGVNPRLKKKDLLKVKSMIAQHNVEDFWITEGGTHGHEWPEPVTGIAAQIHNSFVHGDVKAFVPWQITASKPNTHGIMVYDKMTPKTYAARHFTSFIEAGSVRVETKPTETEVAASAYYNQDNNNLTVVLINSSDDKQQRLIDLKKNKFEFNNAIIYRTSKTEEFKKLTDFELENTFIDLVLPGQSIVTLLFK